MYIYKNNSSFIHSERKVNKIKLQAEPKSSLKKTRRVDTSKKIGGKKRVRKLTQSNKDFLEQLGYTLKK